MVRKTFSVLFLIKRTKTLQNLDAPIIMRITVNGQRAELSLHRGVEPEKWDQARGRVKGNSTEATELNDYLKEKEMKVHQIKRNLEDKDLPVTATVIKNAFLGIDSDKHGVLEAFAYHNKMCKELEGKDFAPATVKRYETSMALTKEYTQYKYKQEDIPLKAVDYDFITGFMHYLKTKRKCNNNTTVKYVRNFRKIINLALKNEWINKDPFINIKMRLERVDKEFLTKTELKIMIEKQFNMERLQKVKDIFVFCCFTGLAFTDVQRLSRDHLQESIDGNKRIIIKIKRQKTDIPCRIPVLQVALEILTKYKDDPFCQRYKVLLPLPSNQKMNAYLKEIADACGIKKHLTTHMARHTFATTVTLAEGMSIEVVSKLLGHANIRSTEIYARVLDTTIEKEMSKINGAFTSNPSDEGTIKLPGKVKKAN